ncbi:toprim domain-containing protein [Marinobacter sp. CP1]|jgi:putative DNA primase/helicase|uniref:toprim domain-containing protein n=1 Tax=Marinobacter sp. CP1 TaxID=1671721 RepID=UPI00069E405F|nr:toprim domain-containing protein [Marinobacter sp. CP1]
MNKHYSAGDIIDRFRQVLADAGLPAAPETNFICDGLLHRFRVEDDKKGSRNGWYVLHLDGVPAGAFGSWRAGIAENWCIKGLEQLTEDERRQLRERMERAKTARQSQLKQRQATAAQRARNMWQKAKPASPDHPYLVKKQVPPFRARQIGPALVLDIRDITGQLSSLQFIQPDGAKKLLSGGAKQERFIPVTGADGGDPETILICEGWATGATLAASMPAALVLAAIDAGNLPAVAVATRQRWPGCDLIICGDDDRKTEGNPGATAAKRAAELSAARLALPEWPQGCPVHLSDFNDLATWLNEVKQ